MERELADHEFLAGAYSYADIAFYMAQLFGARKGAPMTDETPRLLAWRERMTARPAVQTNALSFVQRLLPRNVELVRHGGPLSQLLDGLGASTILRLDVVKDAQLVLNLPTPLKAFDEPGKQR